MITILITLFLAAGPQTAPKTKPHQYKITVAKACPAGMTCVPTTKPKTGTVAAESILTNIPFAPITGTEEYFAAELKEQQHKDNLIWAARSRVLTDKEMAEVQDYGVWLLVNVSGNQSVYEPEVKAEGQKEFDELLLQQFRLRAVKAEQATKPCGVTPSAFPLQSFQSCVGTDYWWADDGEFHCVNGKAEHVK